MWKNKVFFLIYITNLSVGLGFLDNPPVVETDLGKIQGAWKRYLLGREYAAFEGIPFAKPPIGKFRWKNPEPVEPWNGTLKATEPLTCIQKVSTDHYEGDEDCLYLNIYVPKNLLGSNNLSDVIVHIHGGAFTTGSGAKYATPGFLMEKDVVFVTINYRLYVFGFLSTEDEVISGNFGLKDQVMALKFVQDHIKAFNGNKGSVTLTGISAGAASVHFHYFSPLSEGLFHRGVSQSGHAIDCWSVQEKAREKAFLVGKLNGCQQKTSKELLECLQKKPMLEIMDKTQVLDVPYGLPIPTFAGVIESNKSAGAFLTSDPYELLEKGQAKKIPWIASSTDQEGLFLLKYFVDDLEKVDDKWAELAPRILDFNASVPSEKLAETAQNIRDYYVPNQEEFSANNTKDLIKMISDRLLLTSGEQAVRMQSKIAQVHYYSLRFVGSLSFSKLFPSKIPLIGATHGDDIFYQYPTIIPLIPEADRRLRDLYVDFIVNFAKTGEAKFGNGITWNHVKDDELNVLFLDGPDDIHLDKIDQLAPIQFWSSLGLAKNEK